MHLTWSGADAAFRDEVRGFSGREVDTATASCWPRHDQRLRRPCGRHGAAADSPSTTSSAASRWWPTAHRVRRGCAEGPLAPHHDRRGVLLPGLLRARSRLRPRGVDHGRGRRRRGSGLHRQPDLDHARPGGRLDVRAGPDVRMPKRCRRPVCSARSTPGGPSPSICWSSSAAARPRRLCRWWRRSSRRSQPNNPGPPAVG